MKKLALLMFVLVVLSGCATGSALVTGTKRSPLDPNQVKIYFEKPLDYEVIGIVNASSGAGWTEQDSLDYAVKELQNQAAKLGANGVLLESTGEKTSSVVGGTFGNTYGTGYGTYGTGYSYAIPVSAKTVSGQAIYVTEGAVLETHRRTVSQRHENEPEFTETTEENVNYNKTNPSPIKMNNLSQEDALAQDKALQWYEKSYQNVMDQQWAEAIRTSSAAIAINPNLTAAYVNRAWAYIEKGLFSEAIEDCNKAIEIENNNAAAFNNRGLAYSKLGEDKKAIMNYRKACEFGVDVACDNFKEKTGYLPSEEITFFQKKAIESFSSNDFDQVISATGKMIGIDPKNAEAYSMRCEAKAYKGLVEEAKEDCKKSIESNPDFSMAYNNLGYVLELKGTKLEAIVYYEMSCGMGNKTGCQNQQRLSSSTKKHGGSPDRQ